MQPKNNNPTQQQPTPTRYDMQYNNERKTVLLWVQGASMMEMPFDIFKKFYYAANEAHKANQRIIPARKLPPNLRS